MSLTRGLILSDDTLLAGWYWHVGYLVTFTAIFAAVAHRLLSRRLVT